MEGFEVGGASAADSELSVGSIPEAVSSCGEETLFVSSAGRERLLRSSSGSASTPIREPTLTDLEPLPCWKFELSEDLFCRA